MNEDLRRTALAPSPSRAVYEAVARRARARAANGPVRPPVEAGALGNRGRVVVADNGAGMHPEPQARTFQPFFSTDRGTGPGLGLAFRRRFVQAAQGTLRVKSAPLRGAMFTIESPRA